MAPVLETVFRLRNVLASLPLLLAIGVAKPGLDNQWGVWSTAVLLTLLGIGLRAWGNRHCNYNSRARNILARTGPYALTRNPLYIGNALIILGAIAASNALWLALPGMVWVFTVYNLVVRREEPRMLHKYGQEYADWCARVPRWIPHLSNIFPSREHLRVALQDAAALIVLLPFVAKEFNLFGLWS